MPTMLIAGANRGIGLEFARQYAADGWHVIATARHPDSAGELTALPVELLPLDIADPASIAALAQRLSGRPIDLLIANAGVSGPRSLERDGWLATFATNSIGPTLLADALKPNVAAGDGRKMIAITSRMGSIAETSGGFIPYRSSKAALNAAWRALSVEWQGEITLAMLHPGWVQTDMGGPNAAIDTHTSVAGMRKVIRDLSPERSGAFLAWDGAELAW
ncbi:MAG TPA: SDR family oxidoreductase [Sphingomonas sp.]|nr:SDR family oxidoreductase [Sphingomonas sp.]